jgi:hypothetical protein
MTKARKPKSRYTRYDRADFEDVDKTRGRTQRYHLPSDWQTKWCAAAEWAQRGVVFPSARMFTVIDSRYARVLRSIDFLEPLTERARAACAMVRLLCQRTSP